MTGSKEAQLGPRWSWSVVKRSPCLRDVPFIGVVIPLGWKVEWQQDVKPDTPFRIKGRVTDDIDQTKETYLRVNTRGLLQVESVHDGKVVVGKIIHPSQLWMYPHLYQRLIAVSRHGSIKF